MTEPGASYFDTSTWREPDVLSGGPSELGLSGSLENWDRSGDLPQIDVPTLVIGGTHDTMDPAHMRWMARQLPQGRYLHCPDGSHLAQSDDPSHYIPGLIGFLTSL